MKAFGGLGIVLCAVFGTAVQLHAIVFISTGDSGYNTTAPTGDLLDSGWQYQGVGGSFLGTPISEHHFITATHVGGTVGQTFSFQGTSYSTVAREVSPNSDLTIWV
jgi:hypothetical protein